jgi:DNA-binding Lrp family transcriptional regulator
MKIYSEDIIILKELYAKQKVSLYELHEKYRLSPAQIMRCIEKLNSKEIIKIFDDFIVLTKLGAKWIDANRSFIYMQKFEYISRFNEELYSIKKIKENSLYKPIIKSLDSKILKEGEK